MVVGALLYKNEHKGQLALHRMIVMINKYEESFG
jgi:hypothetical protein